MKIKRGIRFNTFIKTAICFMIFYLLSMGSLTFLLGALNYESLQTDCTYALSDIKSGLEENILVNNPEYDNDRRLMDYNSDIISFLYSLSSKKIYCSAALVDENNNILCNTENVLYSSSNLVFLDKSMTKQQIRKLISIVGSSGFSVNITGKKAGYEIIPTKISSTPSNTPGSKIQFEFILNNKYLNDPDIISFESRTFQGFFERYGVENIMNEHTEKRYDEVKSKVHSYIDGDLKDIIKEMKSKRVASSTISDSINEIYKFRYKSFTPIYNPNTDEHFYLVYSYMFFPLEIAFEQLIPLYIFCFIISAVLILILSSILSGWIVKPILKLNKTAINMANGEKDISYNLEKKRNDEIGQLSESLDTMSAKLKESMQKLEEDIEFQKKSEQQRRELTSAIAHELKTPLGIIRNYSEGLKENIKEDKKDHYLDVIIDETEQMDKMVLEMLDLSKLEANAYKLKPERYSLKELILNRLERYKSIIDEKKINVEFISDNECNITADYKGIGQAVSNFILNAINHTPEGKNIKIILENIDNKVKFSVENEGEHIPEEQMPKIWDSFYKVDTARERSKGGTGLGLSIAKNYLELHKAQFGCENTENGVRFWFII